tara:strand:- start:1999 stop:2466 length:468 start_codon:yes stop_codon:yes gene_type:complete
MNKEDKLNLKNMVSKYNPVETTDKIRELKHSEKIRENVTTYLELKKKYKRLSKEQFLNIVQNKCYFLYENYTNIFNKLVKDELDLTILNKFLYILSKIENGEIDQHEGSVMVGNILKELYIDSALRKGKKSNNNKKKERTRKGKNITWNDYKKII